MISPHTKPGTEVVALRDAAAPGMAPLQKGAVYVVLRIVPGIAEDCGRHGVELVGMGPGRTVERPPFWAFWRRKRTWLHHYSTHLFRPLDRAATEGFYAQASLTRRKALRAAMAGLKEKRL